MKVLRFFFLGCFFVLAIGQLSYADLIRPNWRQVSRCVTVDNLDDFPEIAVIGVYGMALYDEPLSGKENVYQVKKGSCLTKGYKFNSLGIYWVAGNYLKIHGIEKLPIKEMIELDEKKDKHIIEPVQQYGLISKSIEPLGGSVPNNNLLIKEELLYNLSRDGDVLTLILVKKVSHFNDGTKKIEDLTTSVSASHSKKISE